MERAERLAAEGMSAATSATRRAAIALVDQPWFEPVLCAAIGVNILLVAVEDAVPAGPGREQLSHSAEIAFAVIFSVELAVQMTAVGVLAFLRNSRSRVDLVVTLSSVLVLMSGSTSFNVNVLRLLRLECAPTRLHYARSKAPDARGFCAGASSASFRTRAGCSCCCRRSSRRCRAWPR